MSLSVSISSCVKTYLVVAADINGDSGYSIIYYCAQMSTGQVDPRVVSGHVKSSRNLFVNRTTE